jgi:hypothetical protein
LTAAWILDGKFLQQQWASARLAVPGVLMMVGLALERAYAKPGSKSAPGQTTAIVVSFTAQLLLQVTNPGFAVPVRIFLMGFGLGAVPTQILVRYLPPLPTQMRGVNAPAAWLETDLDVRVLLGLLVLMFYLLAVAVLGRL